MVRAHKLEIGADTYAQYATPVDGRVTYSPSDLYAILLCAFLLLCGLPILAAVAVFSLVPFLVIWAYGASVRGPTDFVPRNGASFVLLQIVVAAFAAPAIVAAAAWVAAVRVVVVALSAPVGLTCCSTSRESRTAARAFEGRPGVVDDGGKGRSSIDEAAQGFRSWFPLGDVVVCILGGIHRQGLCDMWWAFVWMVYFLPVYKYAVVANSWLYDLQDVYVNQWSAPLDANADLRVDSADAVLVRRLLRSQICRPKLAATNRDLTDAWPFAGFYPYPPSGRASRTHVGLQFSDSATMMVALLTHTAHPSDLSDPTVRNIPGHTPKSEHADFTVSSVYLQKWNPFHHLTGYVEVNVRKDGGVEHPMWLIADVKGSKLHTDNIVGTNQLFVRLGIRFADYIRTQPEFQEGMHSQTGAPATEPPVGIWRAGVNHWRAAVNV